jgi:signal transduction histidine kinase
LLALHLTEPVAEPALAKARQQVLASAGLQPQRQGQVKDLLVGEEHLGGPPGPPLQLLQSLPISDQGELLAQLVLFQRGATGLTEGTRQALGIVADRFLIVARYLRQIKEIEQVKADFVSMLVHDLRAPLTGIRGFNNTLAQGFYGAVNPEQQTALDHVESGCDRMLGLIGDILDLSKLEAGKLKIYPAPLQLRGVAERALRDLAPLFQEKEIEVHLDLAADTPYIFADGKQLARVFVNLLANAAGYTPAGGRVTISAGQPEACPIRQLKGYLEVCVTDTGDGIPTELQQQLFRRFQQLQGRGGFPKGTGLGLAICREIVTLHQGEIWVESPLADGRGSRFHFTLPLAE